MQGQGRGRIQGPVGNCRSPGVAEGRGQVSGLASCNPKETSERRPGANGPIQGSKIVPLILAPLPGSRPS